MPTTLTQKVAVFIATGAYIGYFPWAPGTAGSVLGIVLGWGLSRRTMQVQIGLLVGFVALGVCTADTAERCFGIKDHAAIVIDEIVGMALALFSLPFQTGYVLTAFVLFRVLDIVKPMARLERLPGGWGIMCDDLAAAVIANIMLQGLRLVFL